MSVPKRIGNLSRTSSIVAGTTLSYGLNCPRFEFQNVYMNSSQPLIQLVAEFLYRSNTGGT
jgi:hypothetical protein